MNVRTQLACLWAGFGFLVLYGIGFVAFARFIPVPSPDMSAMAVVETFRERGTAIRIGMFIGISAAVLYVPWSVTMFIQARRMESGRAPVGSYVVLITGILNFILFATPSALWMLVAFSIQYRPDLPATSIQMINDMAWLLFVLMYSPAAAQAIAMGIVGLQDHRSESLIPRWLSYYSIFTGMSFIPAGLVAFFITGPFAWNGLVSIYIPLFTFALWFFLFAPFLHRAIRREESATP